MLKQDSAPLFETLLNRSKRKVISFHTPGHKNGQGISKELCSFTGRNVYYFDVTVFPEVDSLHEPVGCIKEAQMLMAKAYGVKNSFFLVNGSTVGNIAMIMAVCNPGDSIIVSRSCHKSVLAGIILANVWPIWLEPVVDKDLDLLFEPPPEKIKEAIIKFPEAKAVFITSPNYNGITPDIPKIVEICRKYNKILLVDEAHGPHFKFHKDLPISAVECGADLCVQSTHKILSALSQGAVIHYNSELVDINRLKNVISMLQTTSPNYLIMASIDLARKQAFLNGEKIFDKVIKYCAMARNKINENCKKMFCITKEQIESKNYKLDTTKLTVNVSRTGMSGYEVEEILAKDFNIQVDCADSFSVVAISGIGTTKDDLESFAEAIIKIDRKSQHKEKKWKLDLPRLSSETVMLPRDAFISTRTKRFPIEKSVSYISAQVITPYPPGIPIITPGERITADVCNYLLELSERAIKVCGREDKILKTIKVVA